MTNLLARRSAAMLATAAMAVGFAAAGPASAMDLTVPRPDHVVVVVMENHSFAEIIGSGKAPFIDSLAAGGATFTNSFAAAHPSQPNYFALFSGSTQGVRDNGVYLIAAPTLAGSLRADGRSFIGYVEHGSPRKHNPWESFVNSQSVEQDISKFPRDFTKLPTVSFVTPNLDNDMHDGSIARGDAWLRRHLGAYAEWCAKNNDLLIVTFDESHQGASKLIPTLFFGGPVEPGQYGEQINHYTVLRTIEAMYDLPALADTAGQRPITGVWKADLIATERR
jgi:phosphatidylinositol-3-phosphatase